MVVVFKISIYNIAEKGTGFFYFHYRRKNLEHWKEFLKCSSYRIGVVAETIRESSTNGHGQDPKTWQDGI